MIEGVPNRVGMIEGLIVRCSDVMTGYGDRVEGMEVSDQSCNRI